MKDTLQSTGKIQLENTTGLASHKSKIRICNQTQTEPYYWEQIVTF